MNSRREFLGIAGTSAVALLLFGRPTGAGATLTFTVNHTQQQWKQILGPQRYHILREAGTERAFSSPLNDEHRRGMFLCAACALGLFDSATKFDSGTGWPSFFRALPHAVVTRGEGNLFFGTEILCARCGGHLGHVFNDGPKPTGLRYCMNGVALNFRAA